MVIKRQKLFTRGEKRALRELYNATKGFRHMPVGKGVNLTPRDVYRFDQLALSLNKWGKGQKLLPEEITEMKTFLNHAGLNKSSAQLEKVLGKYTNKKALIRLNRMKEANIDSTNRQLERQYDRIRARRSRLIKESNQAGEAMSAKLSGSKNDKKKFKEIKSQYENWKNRYDVGEIRVGGGAKNAVAVPNRTEVILNARNNYGDEVTRNGLAEGLTNALEVKGIDSNKIDLTRKGGNIFISGKATSGVPNVSPEIAFHELGHVAASSEPIGLKVLNSKSNPGGINLRDSRRQFLYRGNELINQGTQEFLPSIAAENRASSKALSMMRKSGVSTPDLIRSKKNLGTALQTYVAGGEASIIPTVKRIQKPKPNLSNYLPKVNPDLLKKRWSKKIVKSATPTS